MNNSLVGKRVRIIFHQSHITIDGDVAYEPCNPGDCYILNNVINVCYPEIKYGDGIRVQNFCLMFPMKEK